METTINTYQRKLNNRIDENKTKIRYKDLVEDIAKELAEKLTDFPRLPKSTNGIDIYTEACTYILCKEYMDNIENYEFSLFKDSKLPIYQIINVLEEHPYLINLIHRNITNNEWDVYRKKILEEIQIMYGKRLKPSELENICNIEKDEFANKKHSLIHRFHYFMGLDFDEQNVSIKFGDIMNVVGDDCCLLIPHLTEGVKDSSITIYKQIERINKALILNEEKVKRLQHIIIPERIYHYENNYEVIYPDKKIFCVCLSYDDSSDLVKCTFSLATQRFPIKFLDRYVNGACPRTLLPRDIEIYLQEWVFEKFGESRKSVADLERTLFMLQSIAQDNYTENIERCINGILRDRRLKDIMINKTEEDIFFTYVHGLRLLNNPSKGDVVKYIRSYLVDE